MYSNEIEKDDLAGHLLKWLTATISHAGHLRELSEITQTTLVLDLLKLADAKFFQSLNDLESLDIGRVLSSIESHLQNSLGKTIKRRYQNKLHLNQDIVGLMGLVIYECVHSPDRQKFISGIMELEAETQRYLMHIIDHTDDQIENVMEIREILDKVEELENQNDSLKKQLIHEKGRNEELTQRLDELLLDNHQLGQECDQLNKEKGDVMKELNLETFGEYLQFYRKLQQQNTEINAQLEISEGHCQQLEKDKESYIAKIMEDSELISILSEQLERMKGVCKTLRLNSSFSLLELETSQESTTHRSEESPIHKENKELSSVELSTSTSLSDKFKRMCSRDSTDSPSFLRLRYEFQQTRIRCEDLQSITENQRETLNKFQVQNSRLSRYNNFMREQLNLLRVLNEQFRQKLCSSE